MCFDSWSIRYDKIDTTINSFTGRQKSSHNIMHKLQWVKAENVI